MRLLAIPHRMYRRGGHTIFQTSRTAHGLEISNAAPASGRPDSPFEGKPADFGWLDGRIVTLDYSAHVAVGRRAFRDSN